MTDENKNIENKQEENQKPTYELRQLVLFVYIED